MSQQENHLHTLLTRDAILSTRQPTITPLLFMVAVVSDIYSLDHQVDGPKFTSPHLDVFFLLSEVFIYLS